MKHLHVLFIMKSLALLIVCNSTRPEQTRQIEGIAQVCKHPDKSAFTRIINVTHTSEECCNGTGNDILQMSKASKNHRGPEMIRSSESLH